MPSSKVSLGLFVPLVAKPEKVNDVAEFLSAGYDLVQAEEETIQWYGIKYSDHTPTTFAIFDTFLSEGGRVKHVEGKVAEALMANAGELLGPAPAISKVELLANKVTPLSGGRTGRTAGLSVGLRVFLTAKPEKAKAVRDFLISALPLVEEESETPVWYALEFPGTNKFAIVDFFENENGRDAHVNGKVAAALFSSADDLLSSPPDLVKFEVVAAKVSV